MRLTRIVSLAIGSETPRPASVEDNQRLMLHWLDRSAELKPDFVCFPEIALHQGLAPPQELAEAQTVPGPSTEVASEHAKRLGTHVIWPLVEREAGRCYNTSVLIGRDGRIIGRYRKYQPTSYEMADGICPGVEVPVWETDRVRVGIAVCFDVKFPEIGLALSRGRANVVFWPSMFVGGLRLNSWARDYGFHVVSCYAHDCTIVDAGGRRVSTGQAGRAFAPGDGLLVSAFAELNTDCKAYHLDYNQDKLPAITEKYGSEIDVCYCRDEGTFVLSSNMQDRSVLDIEREFGLEDLRAYLDKAIADRQRCLESEDRV